MHRNECQWQFRCKYPNFIRTRNLICAPREVGAQFSYTLVDSFSFIKQIGWPLFCRIARVATDLRFVKKITRPDFQAKKFYTLKVRKLRLFLLKEKQRKCIYISYFSSFFVKILTVSVQDHTRCV